MTDEKHLQEPQVDPDAIRAADDAAGTPTLDVDPGPALPVTVTALRNTSDELLGWVVEGTSDEALARRLIEKHITDEYGLDDENRQAIANVSAETTQVTASPFVWVDDPDQDEERRLLVDPAAVSAPFQGVRFILADPDELF